MFCRVFLERALDFFGIKLGDIAGTVFPYAKLKDDFCRAIHLPISFFFFEMTPTGALRVIAASAQVCYLTEVIAQTILASCN